MKHSIRKLGLQRYIHVSFLVLLTPLCLAAPFIDTFETDTSEHYTGSDSFGSGGSFTVSTATATLDVNATGENTYLAMLDDGEHFLETGEFVEAVSSIGVGASAPHQYLVVSNTNVQPSVDEGFRFRRSPSLRIWGGTAPGGATTLDDPGNDGGLTYRIERITPTEFRFLYNAGEGFVDLGSYELPDASPRMHVGLQSWAGTTPFDRLIIDTIPTEENVPPTGISLSRDSVRAGSPAGTLVGELTAFDPNPGDTFSFHLVSVDGNSKSSVFEIAQNQLRTLIELNDSATYEVELRVEDSEGLALTKVFSVSVTEQPVIVFGALADVQYSDKPTAGARDYRGSRPRLQSAVDYFNTQSDLDFVISLGDFIDDRWESFDAVVPIWEQLNAPNTYHLLGNHDYVDIGEENIPLVPDRLGMPAPNYTFNVNGSEDNFLFVVLDGQEFATFTTLPGTPERAFADRLRARASSRGSNGFDWNGGLGPIQFSWLRNELDIASREGIQVILFCHYPIFPLGSEHNNHSDHELKALVEQYPVVKVWMNGHQHGGDYASDAGVHFYTMKGMVEQQGSNAYAVCELYEDRLEINGFGSDRDRSLEFSDHENGLSPIKEFELSRDGLVITLDWDDLNVGESGYAIERRQVGDDSYVRLAVTGEDETTFEDSFTEDAEEAEYRYRIAPVDGDAVGPWGAFRDVSIRLPEPLPFSILEIAQDNESGRVQFSWPSDPGDLFIIERSPDLREWIELDDSYPAADEPAETTAFTHSDLSGLAKMHYRVIEAVDGGGEFIDEFETDTSENYTGSDSFGSGGSFIINTEAGTLDLQAAGGNTYLAMLNDGEHFLEAGEYLEVVSVTGVGASSPHQYVIVSNTNVQPAEFEGFRFRRSPSLRVWGGTAPGAGTTLADPGNDGGLTYRIERLSSTEFRFLYDSGEGFTDLGTYELPGAAPRMYVGVQAWAGTAAFASLAIGNL